MSLSDIPEYNTPAYRKLLFKVSSRMLRSAMWSDARRQEWVEDYAMWRRIQSMQGNNDEYSLNLGLAFSLVEQINAKITEPMLQMGVPYGIYPNELGDQKAANNFAQMVRDFYAKPHVQMGKRRSKKEMVITGNRWEVDEWLHIERDGKMWGKAPVFISIPLTTAEGTPLNQPIDPATSTLWDAQTMKPVASPAPNGRYIKSPFQPTEKTKVSPPVAVKIDAEVDRKILTHYGHNTRYPSVFDMYPEPDKKTIDSGSKTDVSWCVEDMQELALEDLAKEMVVDPHDNVSKPMYNFEALLAAANEKARDRYKNILEGREIEPDQYGPLITPNRDWAAQTDWGRVDKDKVYPTEGTVDRASSEDRDKIWVARHYEAGEILTVAQGRFIIHRKVQPWHVPRLRIRIENYTSDPEFIYGPGALRPIKRELEEMDDIHSLTMDEFFRTVNRMLYIKEDAIVSMEDFAPRGGGKIRISENVADIRQAVLPDQPGPSVTQSMIGAESNTRGLIEYQSSVLDGAPGVRGTKQDHKTKGGMEVVAQNTNTRFIVMQAHALINEAAAGLSMQELVEQFQFEKRPYRVINEDGSTAFAKFNKDDIHTDGRGFNFVIEVDPLWGNDQRQRQDAQDVFDLGMGYEKLRRESKDPSMRMFRLDLAFEDLLKKHGRRDTSKLFVAADQSIDPQTELQILSQGGVVKCKGDLQHHAVTHLLQMRSPALQKSVEAGKAHPDTIKNLDLLVKMCMAELNAFIQDPMGAAQAKLSNAGMQHPGEIR